MPKERSAMADRMEEVVAADNNEWVSVRTLEDFADLRKNQLESSSIWWPDIGPLGDTSSFSFTHRMGRLGPVTILDLDFCNDVWVNGGENRPHYHVTLPIATPSTAMDSNFSVVAEPGSVAVYQPEGKAGVSRYVGRLLAVMIDRHAVEEALADALGRSFTSQIDFQPIMPATTHAVRSWITMVSLFTEQLFRPGSVLHQPMVGMPFADSMIRGLLLAADHSYRATLEGEATEPPPRAIRAAIEVIEAEPHRPLTVSALAARSYVSVRSLQQGFRAHVGTTPMAYLREVRLRRARQDLLESDPSIDGVASIAFRWGFTNLGRFAAAYATRYGENPAVTLRRSADRAIRRKGRV
jgi:AraC-like DNA-binding protein